MADTEDLEKFYQGTQGTRVPGTQGTRVPGTQGTRVPGDQAGDFERFWLRKFSTCIEKIAGEAVRKDVMRNSDTLSSLSSTQEKITWTKGAMERLEALVDEEKHHEIMTGCACQVPKTRIEHLKEKYAETGNITLVHGMLQDLFMNDIRQIMKLDDNIIDEIEQKCWGMAGVKEGNTIYATKMPYETQKYFEASDETEKRYYYCHCHRVREAIRSSDGEIPKTYCYCGAGFYKGMWDYILQNPVKVEVLESVLVGDNVCKIAIHLPLE